MNLIDDSNVQDASLQLQNRFKRLADPNFAEILPHRVREYIQVLKDYKEKGWKLGSFSEDEVARLKHAIVIYGKEDMVKVAEYVGNRNVRQCRTVLTSMNYHNKL